MNILGISCDYHDSAACLLQGGVLVAAAQEERFSRKKGDADLPLQSIRFCLQQAGLRPGDRLDAVAFYDKPLLKFHRLLQTQRAVAPRGLGQFLQAVPVWLRRKLWVEARLTQALEDLGISAPERLLFPEHHLSHAASAFYPSPFPRAAILTVDGVGEWATTTLASGTDHRIDFHQQLTYPHSLGLLYSAITQYCGFRVNSGEYKLMGLAPYGEPRYVQTMLDHLIDLRDDGSFALNLDYFDYLGGDRMAGPKLAGLLGGPPRAAEGPIERRHMDVARSIQEVAELVLLRLASHLRKTTGLEHLCLAGGVALNCVANGKLLRSGLFRDLWIQPAAGDAGGALGAAWAVWHGHFDQARQADGVHDAMHGALLGPEFSEADIQTYLDRHGYPYTRIADAEWPAAVAQLLADQQVVALCQGRMEFGPRALGNRSIVGDPRSPHMQSQMNLKIKFRESFRPFAPSVLQEHASAWFDLDRPSPYMLLVADVAKDRQLPLQGDEKQLDLTQWVNRPRSSVPAITHVDHSARIQTVSQRDNPRYYELIQAFERLTGCPLLINTSFNVRGEPIVCTPDDAYRCFMRTSIDALALGPFLLHKLQQPRWQDRENWREEFRLD